MIAIFLNLIAALTKLNIRGSLQKLNFCNFSRNRRVFAQFEGCGPIVDNRSHGGQDENKIYLSNCISFPFALISAPQQKC